MKLSHVAIAVKDLDAAVERYKLLGLEETHREEVPAQKVRVAFLSHPGGSETSIELLEPTDESGAVGKFLANRGPGIHHLAFASEDIAAEMRRLKDGGMDPIEREPRPGACGHKVCFLHPKKTGGVLMELVEEGSS